MFCPILSKVVSHNGDVGIYAAECKEHDCPWWLTISRRCTVPAIWTELSAIEQHLNTIAADMPR